MSMRLVIGEDFPRAHWMLDDVSPYADYSGYDRSATTTGSPNRAVGLAKGAARSLVVNNANKLSVEGPVMKRGKEGLPFTIEVFCRPVVSDPANITEQQIFGNDGAMDGITVHGTVVSFVTKYTNTGEARCSFDTIDLMNLGIAAVHTKSKNQLYINGDLVAEVDITDEQQADTYASLGNNLTCGSSTSTNSLMLNSLALFDHALDDDSIITHYAHSQDTLGAEDVSIDYGGALLEFGPEGQLAPFFQIEYSSEEEWSLGQRFDCSINEGVLYPSVSSGMSVPGRWETVIPLGTTTNSIYAANLIWEGVGALVETSRDGIDWTVARKGVALSTVPKGTNGTNQFLYVRVSFAGGIANDPSYFDNMVFSLYTSGTIPSYAGREVVLDKATPEDDTDVIDLHQNWGVELESGTVTIKSGSGETFIPARTVEVWAMKTGTTFTDNLAATATASYTNGGTFQSYRTGEWQLRHYVFPSGFSENIVFSGTGQIGHVVLYPTVLSADVVKEIYESYTGKPRLLIDVDEVFDVHEFTGAVDIYEYDWSIETAG